MFYCCSSSLSATFSKWVPLRNLKVFTFEGLI